jgi:hypothetical protein
LTTPLNRACGTTILPPTGAAGLRWLAAQ